MLFQLDKPNILPEDAPRVFFEPLMVDGRLPFMQTLDKTWEKAAKAQRQSLKRACPSTTPTGGKQIQLTSSLEARYSTTPVFFNLFWFTAPFKS
jgi:hypothetical protein